MIRRAFFAVVLVSISAATLMAQAGPTGWKLRIDESTSASDPDGSGSVRFTSTNGGVRAVTPQAAVFWQPVATATGTYTLKGTFALNEPSNHSNYYGLVLGGRNLDSAAQSYVYFTVAQNGTWLLKKRQGEVASDVTPRGSTAAIRRPDAGGKSSNDLEVRVGNANVDFVVNGTIVHSTPRAAIATDGLYGMRVNHFLDVTVTGLAVTR
ncbi:MAG: hypothetical protein ABL986_00955 [Vicinamibacterales bacterium]